MTGPPESVTAQRRVLVVEDDRQLAGVITQSLRQIGLVVDTVGDGAEAMFAIRGHRPDLVLLDLDLPSIQGLEICRRLKRDVELSSIPVVIMTAHAAEVDRIVGLELGADDYIGKPFNVRELTLRVQAVLRRSSAASPTVQSFGSLSVDIPAREVTVEGGRVSLTAKEFDLLAALVSARGRPLSRATLLREVWGYENAGEVESRTVDVHVRRLRRKLGAHGARLETMKHVGYRFMAGVLQPQA